MPIDYKFDPETNIVYANCRGIISLEETEEYVNKIWADETIPQGVVDIVLFDEIENFAESQDDLWKYREMFARVAEKKKYVASIILAKSPLHIGFARMFQNMIQEEGQDWILIAENEEVALQLAKQRIQVQK